jgi:hypothetical protein
MRKDPDQWGAAVVLAALWLAEFREDGRCSHVGLFHFIHEA